MRNNKNLLPKKFVSIVLFLKESMILFKEKKKCNFIEQIC